MHRSGLRHKQAGRACARPYPGSLWDSLFNPHCHGHVLHQLLVVGVALCGHPDFDFVGAFLEAFLNGKFSGLGIDLEILAVWLRLSQPW